jgi:hypothetical protein
MDIKEASNQKNELISQLHILEFEKNLQYQQYHKIQTNIQVHESRIKDLNKELKKIEDSIHTKNIFDSINQIE